jgi:hypothetical protein
MTRRKKSNRIPLASSKASPFKKPERGPFKVEEDLSITAIKTIQDGMLNAFQLGRNPEKENPAVYLGYVIIISSCIIAVIIFFWKGRFSLEYQQVALGYIFSIIPAASFFGITKSKR